MTSIDLHWLDAGDLLSVPGWRGAAVRAGIKKSGSFDLTIFQSEAPGPAAAVFTRNALPAACVRMGRDTLAESPLVRTIVVNAGNANAMTGSAGLESAREMCRLVEEACGGPVLAFSTGIIGVPLPMDKVRAGIAKAAASLEANAPNVADAILTTDTTRKTCAVTVALPASPAAPAQTVTVGGMAKGSGMIHPNMATMLAFVATDAPVEPETLDAIHRRAVDLSFHEITVDGDTSTNDSAVLMAASGPHPIGADDPRLAPLEHAVTAVMQKLARDILLDGEGRSRIMEVVVEGARTRDEAKAIADAVTGSNLVKTALAGGDPNWGRILAAAANAGIELDGTRTSLDLCGVRVFEAGLPTGAGGAELDQAFSQDEVRAVLGLGLGGASARRWTSDLTEQYVRINSEYST